MPDADPRLILGSSSRYRRQLLQRVIPSFETASPDIDETPEPGELPQALAARLAAAKAATIAATAPDAVIIGSDQVAALGTRVFGKPGGRQAALQQLRSCSGQEVNFFTAVSVICPAQAPLTHVDITRVQFRTLAQPEIERYVEIEQPWDCAGSFKSEGLGVALFTAIHTQDPTALIGLPMIWVTHALRQAGINPLGT